MLTDRAEGLMRLSRTTKYALVSVSVPATVALSVSSDVESAVSSMLLPTAILLLTQLAFGSSWQAWGRTYFHHPVHTTLWVTALDTIIVGLSLLSFRTWLPSTTGIPLGLCLLTSATTLLLLNRFLPAALSSVLFRRQPRPRVLVLGPPDAMRVIRRQLTVAEAVAVDVVDGTAAPDTFSGLRLFDPEQSTEVTSQTLAPIHSRIDQPDSPHAVDRVVFVRYETTQRTLELQHEIHRRCDAAGLPLTVFADSEPASDNTDWPLSATSANDTCTPSEPLQNPVNLATKRSLDILVSIPFVVFVLPPLCLAVWLVHRSQSPGPLFYRQKRCGLNGSTFHILKFRTMHVPAPGETDLEDNPAPRIFELGAVLRDSRLDEIPQFINVLLGTMSVVGPRAHHGPDREKFSLIAPQYPMRMQVKPGITGPAQYREYRGIFHRSSVGARVACDLEYIRHWSLQTDLLLVFKTGRVIAESLYRAAVGKLRRQTVPVTTHPSVTLEHPVLASVSNSDYTDQSHDPQAA